MDLRTRLVAILSKEEETKFVMITVIEPGTGWGARYAPFHEVLENLAAHDSYGDVTAAAVQDLSDFLVIQANNVLSVNLQKLVVRQDAVSRRGRLLDNLFDPSVFEAETGTVGAVLQHCNCSLEWSIGVDQT